MGKPRDIRARMQIMAFMLEADAIGDNAGVGLGEIRLAIPDRPPKRLDGILYAMKLEGLIGNPERGVWHLSPAGQNFFAEHEAEFEGDSLLPPLDFDEPADEPDESPEAEPVSADDSPSHDELPAALGEELGLTEEDYADSELDPEDVVDDTTEDEAPASPPSRPTSPRRSLPPYTPPASPQQGNGEWSPWPTASADTASAPSSTAAVAVNAATLPVQKQSPRHGGSRLRPVQLRPAQPRVRVLPPDPSKGTLAHEILWQVRTMGWHGGIPEITADCRKSGFEVDETMVAAVIDSLIADQFIRQWRYDHPEAPLSYQALSEYALGRVR